MWNRSICHHDKRQYQRSRRRNGPSAPNTTVSTAMRTPSANVQSRFTSPIARASLGASVYDGGSTHIDLCATSSVADSRRDGGLGTWTARPSRSMMVVGAGLSSVTMVVEPVAVASDGLRCRACTACPLSASELSSERSGMSRGIRASIRLTIRKRALVQSPRVAGTEWRRSRTFPAWGCHASPVLKTGWGTGPGHSRAQARRLRRRAGAARAGRRAVAG
jgi:hypothetical protein